MSVSLEQIQFVCHKTGADFKQSKQALIETDGDVFRAIDSIEALKKQNSTKTNKNWTEYVSDGSENFKTIDRKLNIVVVGRSGVGKSSFLNYAAGKKVFETGIGEPITQKYFQEIDVEEPIKNIKYCLFDTKGLEAGNTIEWKNAVYSEIDKRDASDNIYDWFHTVIFCIDASAKRLQPFEVRAILELSKKSSVLVLLTKKDLVESSILEALRKQIITDIGRHVQVLSVCSVSTRTRKGESHASGLEDVLRVSFFGLWEKAAKVLPNKAIKPLIIIKENLRFINNISGLLAFFSLKINCFPHPEHQLSLYPNYKGIGFSLFPNLKEEIYNINQELYMIFDNNNPVPSYLGLYKKISQITNINSSFERNEVILCLNNDIKEFANLPDVLVHDSLNAKYYRESIKLYLHFLYVILTRLKDNLIYNNNILSKISGNKSIIKEILKFYKDITGYSLRNIDDSNTKESCIKLEDSEKYRKFWDKFINKKNEVIKALDDVDSCVFSSGSERRDAEHQYISFKEFVEGFLKEFKDNVDSFIKYYSTELHAYGEYCIREDELSGNNNDHDKNSDDMLRMLIKEALSDGIITSKEYAMIRLVALKQGISDTSEIDKIILDLKHSSSK